MLAAQLPEQFLQAAAAIPDGPAPPVTLPAVAPAPAPVSAGSGPPSLPPVMSTTKVSTGTTGSRRTLWLVGGIVLVVLGGAIAGIVSWVIRAPHSQTSTPQVSADLGARVERSADLTQVPVLSEKVDAGVRDAAAPAIAPTPPAASAAAAANNPTSGVAAKLPATGKPRIPTPRLPSRANLLSRTNLPSLPSLPSRTNLPSLPSRTNLPSLPSRIKPPSRTSLPSRMKPPSRTNPPSRARS